MDISDYIKLQLLNKLQNNYLAMQLDEFMDITNFF